MKNIKETLKTLPINFYTESEEKLGLHIDENLEAAFIDFSKNEITIGLKMFENVENLEEKHIRGLFYHEVSHAILTDVNTLQPINFNKSDIVKAGKELGYNLENINIYDKEIHQALNIIEDERIETILKDYYLGVNFKELARTLIPNEGGFLSTLRLEENTHLHKLLQPLLKANPTYKDYLPLLAAYYEMEESQEGEGQGKSDDENQSGDQNQDTQPDAGEQSESQEKGDNQEVNSPEKQKANARDIVKESISQKMQDFEDNEREQQLLMSIKTKRSIDNLIKEIVQKSKLKSGKKVRAKGFGHTNNTVNALRAADMVENQYKIFNSKRGFALDDKGVNINFFIDASGSFQPSEKLVNNILKKLEDLEKEIPAFTFTLTTIKNGHEETKKNDNRRINCGGGTGISNDFENIFNELNKKKSSNILLLDGFADDYSYRKKGFKYLDRPNMYICSDGTNREKFDKFKRAKVDLVYSNYTDYLEDFILRCLSDLLRKI